MMRENNVDLSLYPTFQHLSSATLPMEIMHVRPDHPDAHQHSHHDHPIAQMLRQAGLPIPGQDEVVHANVPKHHPQGGVTIGYLVDPVNRIINVGFAKCVDEDYYDKKKGVALVRQRMEACDERFTFSLTFDNLLEFTLASMQNLKGLKPSFVETITFDNLSKDAVQYAVGQGMARRFKAMHEEYHRQVHEHEQKKAETKALNKAARKLLETAPPPPPEQPLH